MSYEAPNHIYKTDFKLRQTLASLSSVQDILEASSADDALEKIVTYSRTDLLAPRAIICEYEIESESDAGGGIDVEINRLIGVEFAFYVPEDDVLRSLPEWTGTTTDDVTIDDEHAYVKYQLSRIKNEVQTQVAGQGGQLALTHAKLIQPERIPDEERFDKDEIEKQHNGSQVRSLWYGMLAWKVMS